MAKTTTTQRLSSAIEAGKLRDLVADKLRDVDEDIAPLVVRDLRALLGELDLTTLAAPAPCDPED